VTTGDDIPAPPDRSAGGPDARPTGDDIPAPPDRSAGGPGARPTGDDKPAPPDRSAGGPGARPRRRWSGRARWVVVSVLVVLISLLSIVAVVARYARAELLDTDRYVATVAPLADDPAVQDAITTRVTAAIFSRLDIEKLTHDALEALVARGVPERVVGLAEPLTDQVESYVHDQVAAFVASDAFATLWKEANRVAHTQVNKLLTGQGTAVQAASGTVSIDLGATVAAIKQRLVERGFTPAERIPEVHSKFTIAKSDRFDRIQTGVRQFNRLAIALPFVVFGLGALAVVIAPDRRRGLLVVALGIVTAMVILAAALALGRNWYIHNGHPKNLSKDAALSIGRTLLVPLRTTLRAVLVLGLAVSLAAFLAGGSAAARAVRTRVAWAVTALRGRTVGGRAPSPFEAWVGRHKTALRVAMVAIGALVFALWTYPSGAVVLVIVLAVVAGLLLIELVAPGRSGAVRTP
jgi:hypothetical protein